MLSFFKQHSIALITSIVLLLFVLLLLPTKEVPLIVNEKNKLLDQTVTNGLFPNLNEKETDITNYLASIKNSNSLTLFGSSEFNYSTYASYKYFTNKNGFNVFGVGHAHHQLLSVLIELLAADDFVEGANVAIFLSPGWFQSGEGTNSSAFVEFAKPELLSNIITGKVKSKYKDHIGQFIYEQQNNFDAFPAEFDYLSNLYLKNRKSSTLLSLELKFKQKLKSLFGYAYHIDKNRYSFQLIENENEQKLEALDSTARQEKTKFLSEITNNKLYVSDEYYSKYLIDESGNERTATVAPVDIETNKEYQDFKLVLAYIKEKNINASFIMMPLNPYYFSNLENLLPLTNAISNALKEAQIPYYDMYVTKQEDYDKGLLRDVMHIGDYGWIRINQFLQNVYYKK